MDWKLGAEIINASKKEEEELPYQGYVNLVKKKYQGDAARRYFEELSSHACLDDEDYTGAIIFLKEIGENAVTEKTEELFDKYKNTFPNDGDKYLKQALILLKETKNTDKAIEIYNEIWESPNKQTHFFQILEKEPADDCTEMTGVNFLKEIADKLYKNTEGVIKTYNENREGAFEIYEFLLKSEKDPAYPNKLAENDYKEIVKKIETIEDAEMF